ncbi:glycine betaine ABC transporter substrate-binding protein OsmF [Reinekea marinisedimentorum]|uniref:Osmoprotectant transport system substrate-binding protein n=1 Tax=Reinekea marinisedimentorum TaxID=230495 RepID=A0A4R3HVT8_9GAMM|nr:ABC transporter substrate-binding protein [Reinekea marinisedimentorum]TCS36683.1 osmoprotectant transport system substrate-binding protein [Reinekea marinisedimentorum]
MKTLNIKSLKELAMKSKKSTGTRLLGALMGGALAISSAVPGMAFAASSEPVVVASKIDGEGALLGNILVLMLEKANIPYVDKVQMGATNVVRQALLAGEIDIYPEYTGNVAFMMNDPVNPAWKNWQQGYDLAKKLDFDANKLVWLQPSPANNTWAIAVREDVADKYKLSSLSDLPSALDSGMKFKIATSAEFVERADALPSFENTYDFKLTQDQILAFPGGDTTVFIKSAAENNSGVNAAVVYGTDGSVSALGLKVLDDPNGAQPVYAPAPVVRASVLESHPEIAELLDPVFDTLTTETLQNLNGAVSIDGIDAKTVAREYLTSKGFL